MGRRTMKRACLSLLTILIASVCSAGQPTIIPKPLTLEAGQGTFTMKATTVLVAQDPVWSQNSAAPEYGLALTVKPPLKLPTGRVSMRPYKPFARKNRPDHEIPDGKHAPSAHHI